MADPARRPPRRTLEPAERRRVGLVASWVLGSGLLGIAAVGGLTVWHLARRARLIRETAKPPRRVDWPEGPPRDHPDPEGPAR